MNSCILIDFRKQNDLPQRYIAYKLGVTQQAVDKWERGKAVPRPTSLKKLCSLIGCSVDELLGD